MLSSSNIRKTRFDQSSPVHLFQNPGRDTAGVVVAGRYFPFLIKYGICNVNTILSGLYLTNQRHCTLHALCVPLNSAWGTVISYLYQTGQVHCSLSVPCILIIIDVDTIFSKGQKSKNWILAKRIPNKVAPKDCEFSNLKT